MTKQLFIFLLLCSFFSCSKNKGYVFDGGFKHKLEKPAIFVANSGDNTLSIIDLETAEVIETLQLKNGIRPNRIHFDANQTDFTVGFAGPEYTSELEQNQAEFKSNHAIFQIFNAKSGKHKRNVYMETPAKNAIYAPIFNEIWVGQNRGSSNGEIYIIDPKKGKTIQRLPGQEGISELSFSFDGTKGYACNSKSNTVSVIDPDTKRVKYIIDTYLQPMAAWPAENGYMYVNCENGQSVQEINVKDNEITSFMLLSYVPSCARWNHVTKELWVSDTKTGGVHTYKKNGATWQHQSFIETGDKPNFILFSDDYKTAYVSNELSGTVSIIATATNSVTKQIKVGQRPKGIALKTMF